VVSGGERPQDRERYAKLSVGSCTSNNGNVISQKLTAPKTGVGTLVLATACGYDGVNRITSAPRTAAGTPWSQNYSGTSNGSGGQCGNLTQTGDGLSSSLTCHTYSSINNHCTDAGIACVPVGNVTVSGTWILGYDAGNRQIHLYDCKYWGYDYDGEGRRMKKSVEGTTAVYVYDAMGRLAAEYASAAPTDRPDCTRCYLTADHLGSTRLVTDAEGAAKRRTAYHPLGWEINPGDGNRNSVAGHAATDESNPKFTGKERDAESGLDYFGARYFSAAQGRFTSPDPDNYDARLEVRDRRLAVGTDREPLCVRLPSPPSPQLTPDRTPPTSQSQLRETA
jgi:RHS repeat-associated protein